ncbi:serine/threonine-protein kinase [Nostoc sp. MG11]|uniref:serine/threonine-protein kinase n=1 Tax=Nostoc sp. MG11 TaxID=2721166 RepID=UPI0018690B2D|nr:serine/threonine-protein kinase [Nostoc sp. MG11]
MNRLSSKITNPESSQHQLGQMCGSKQLFRDRYEILRILGRGGFGITYLAKNAVIPGNPLCVIKQLCVKVTSHQSWQRACDRFEKEAKTLGQLGSHSQIPLLLDYFEDNGEFYLVQEYVQGFTLAQEVRRNGTKNETAVKQFLQELLPVLQYLHKHRVIHRDIKPQNLLRCEYDGRVVLIDFGAVKEELADACENSIHKTAFIGTMGFAPPEQFSLRPVYASDIYALGMTCLYLLTGKSPLEFDYDADTGEICWQKEVNISNDFAQVLSKMVKIPLDERFRTADNAIAALNWESYLPTLNNCLTTQHLKNQTTTTENPQVYIPPVARTANAIRKWRARLKETKSRN